MTGGYSTAEAINGERLSSNNYFLRGRSVAGV